MGSTTSSADSSCFSCNCNNVNKAANAEFAPEKKNQSGNDSFNLRQSRSSGRKNIYQNQGSGLKRDSSLVQSIINAQTGMQGQSSVSMNQLQGTTKTGLNLPYQQYADHKDSNHHFFLPLRDQGLNPSDIIHHNNNQKPKPKSYYEIPDNKDLNGQSQSVIGTEEVLRQREKQSVILTKAIDEHFTSSFIVVNHIKKEVFGDMYLVKMKQSGEQRILRRIKKSVLRKVSLNDQVDDFRFDLEELLDLEHPNIARIFDFKEDLHNFYILEEYCLGGRLFSQIEELTEMTENLAAEIMKQIISTITYLHSKSLVYRNLSPDVLLLEDKTCIQDGVNLKLTNIVLQKVAKASRHTFHMSPLYFQAPEVIRNQTISEKQDVWACGIILSILISGTSPHQLDGSSNMVLNALIEGQFNFETLNQQELQPEVITFVKNLLELDHQKRSKSVMAISNKWIIMLTKGKKNNQKKILNQAVLKKLKKFIAEYRLIDSLNEIVQQIAINKEEEKILSELCLRKDQIGEGDLRMDDLREVYNEYNGKFIDKEELDKILGDCTIQMAKKGMIKYSQFIYIKTKRSLDVLKSRVKKVFLVYDQRKEAAQEENYKKGLVSREELKKLINCIMRSNNNQSDAIMSDYDEDQDGYLTIDELVKLVVTLCSHHC